MPDIRSRLQKSVWGIATKEIIFKMLKVMHRSPRKYCSKKDQNYLSLCKKCIVILQFSGLYAMDSC